MATLQVTWHEHTIAKVLRLTVDEACAVFADEAAVARPLRLLSKIGLG